jgi:hypothetical protein
MLSCSQRLLRRSIQHPSIRSFAFYKPQKPPPKRPRPFYHDEQDLEDESQFLSHDKRLNALFFVCLIPVTSALLMMIFGTKFMGNVRDYLAMGTPLEDDDEDTNTTAAAAAGIDKK